MRYHKPIRTPEEAQAVADMKFRKATVNGNIKYRDRVGVIKKNGRRFETAVGEGNRIFLISKV